MMDKICRNGTNNIDILHSITVEIIEESNEKTTNELVKFLQKEENLDKFFFSNQDEISREIKKTKGTWKNFLSWMGQISENDNNILFWLIAVVTIIIIIIILMTICYCGFNKWRQGIKQAMLINEHEGIQLQPLRLG